MLDNEESGQFQRLGVSCELRYKFPDSEQSYIAECLDINGSVIIFRGDQQLESGMALEVIMENSSSIFLPLKAYVEIVRCKRSKTEQYDVVTEIKGIREY